MKAPGGLSLGSRLIILVVVLVLGSSASVALVTMVGQRGLLSSFGDEQAARISELTADLVADSVEFLDMRRLRTIVGNISDQPSVSWVRILDREGRVITDGTIANPERHQPLGREYFTALQAVDEAPISIGDEIVAARTIIVGREPIGIAVVAVTLVPMTSSVIQQLQSAVILVLGFLALGVVVVTWIGSSVRRQVAQLVTGIDEIGQGSFSVAVPVEGLGELASLGVGLERMRRQLREGMMSREAIDAVLKSIDEGVVLVDRGGSIVEVNPAVSILTETDPEKIIGLDLRKFFADPGTLWDEDAELQLGEAEAGIRARDRSVVPVQLRITERLDGDEQRDGLVIVIRRKEVEGAEAGKVEQLEAQIARILRISPDGLLLISGGRVIDANPVAKRFLGIKLGGDDEIEIDSLVAPASRRVLAHVIESAKADETGLQVFESMVWVRRGGARLQLDTAVIITDTDDENVVILRPPGSGSDEDAVGLEALSLVREHIGVLHTRVLEAFEEMLQSGRGRDEAAEIDRLVDDFEDLCCELDDAIALISAELTLERGEVSLESLLQGAIDRSRIGERARLESEARSVLIEVDPPRLRRVVTRMLCCAHRISAPESIIRLQASRNDRRVTISCQWVGGLPSAEARERLFAIPGAPGYGGKELGGGLGVAREVIALHGGTLGLGPIGEGSLELSLELPATLVVE